MTRQLKRRWPTLTLVCAACVILILEYLLAPAEYRWAPVSTTNPFFVAMGKWGIRFLLMSLSITPIYSFTGWRFPIKLRKPAGLIAFGFVSIHAGMHVSNWLRVQTLGLLFQPTFVIYGMIAFTILALMAITSVKPTMKRMGRYWKPLHRCVYAAGLLIMLHSITAATSGKRALFGGQESAMELRIYLAILIVLLAARIPLIRDPLKRVLPFAPNPGRRSLRRRQA